MRVLILALAPGGRTRKLESGHHGGRESAARRRAGEAVTDAQMARSGGHATIPVRFYPSLLDCRWVVHV
jgi:hypothetical protein